MSNLSRAALLNLALTCLSPGLAAETIKVSPGGAISTIQGGVDAAAGGDTVSVSSGVYSEVVVIPSDKTGLKLLAKGKVTLDARPNGVLGSGPALKIEADGVIVQGFTIRHAREDAASAPGGPSSGGHGIFAAANDIIIKKCAVIRCERMGISITGDRAVRRGH
jgi:nitrous oxidase accessory protein NosD